MLYSGLDNLVGLVSEKKKARIEIAAAKVTGEPIGHVLLSGLGGTGKTQFSRSISEELGGFFVEQEAFSLKKPDDISDLIISSNREAVNLRRKLILFIDEVHRLTLRLQEVFYYPMKEWRISTKRGYVNLAPFTLIAATTRKDMLDDASFIQRFPNQWEIKRYHVDHICEIIRRIFIKEKIVAGPSEIQLIANRCLGIPRQANNLAIKIRNYVLSQGRRVVREPDIEYVFSLEKIDSIGLSETHQQYLHELLNANGVPKGVKALAGKLSLHEESIVGSIEPILLTLGFIDICHGRILTEAGRQHLEN